MISALRWGKPDVVPPHFSNYFKLCLDSNSTNKSRRHGGTHSNITTNSLKTESKLSSLLKYMFPALLEVNSLPATIQKSTHLCDFQTTRKLKKNRQEWTQLLNREKARLSSVALISIQCFSEEIFISKEQAGQESNQTQTHTHTQPGQSCYFFLDSRQETVIWRGKARPGVSETRTYRVGKW